VQNNERDAIKISIICPLYNAEKYLLQLHNNILKQKYADSLEILYMLTESSDGTEDILSQMGIDYIKIKKEEFSHSRTRESAAKKAKGDILVFITQDIEILEDTWLENLIKPILEGECEASFSRQICTKNVIEKYIREKNYPAQSRVVSKEDIPKLGLMTFFFSDACSAVKSEVYRDLNGYDQKDLITNEDMYIAYKIINSGYRIKYCSDSIVEHYHLFTLKQLFNRYFDTGVFLTDNPVFLSFKTSDSGMKMAKYVIKQSIKDSNFKVTLQSLPNFASRFIGSYLGKRYKNLPIGKRIKYSSNKSYWKY
jgi:rhamnosyltransferase